MVFRSLLIRLTAKFVRGYVTIELQVFLHVCPQLTDQFNVHRHTLNQLLKTQAEIFVTDPIAHGPVLRCVIPVVCRINQNVMCTQYVVKHNLVLDGMLIY